MTKFINLLNKTCNILAPNSPFLKGEIGAYQIADLSEVGTIENYLHKYLIETIPPIDINIYSIPEIKERYTSIQWEYLKSGTVITHEIKPPEVVKGLPKQEEGIIYISSLNIVEVAKRSDIVCPIYIKDPSNKNVVGAFSFYTTR